MAGTEDSGGHILPAKKRPLERHTKGHIPPGPRDISRIEQVLYLAGPYSKDPEKCTADAVAVQAKLYGAGWAVICPHANSHFADRAHRLPPLFYYAMDLTLLARCDAIVMLPGWRESKGALMEHRHAVEWGLTIYHWEVDQEELLAEVD